MRLLSGSFLSLVSDSIIFGVLKFLKFLPEMLNLFSTSQAGTNSLALECLVVR